MTTSRSVAREATPSLAKQPPRGAAEASGMMNKLLVLSVVAACADDPIHHLPGGEPYSEPPHAVLSGQVVAASPVSGARISIDGVNGETHIADATTDETGAFAIDLGDRTVGFVRVTATGGTYHEVDDRVVALGTRQLIALAPLGRGPVRISPLSTLVDARTTMKRGLVTFDTAYIDATEHLRHHFGDPADEPRVFAGLSRMALDLDTDSIALTRALAIDLGSGQFDGNDDNGRGPSLSVGDCGEPATCALPETGCTIGFCRPQCDLYAGTTRARLATAILDEDPSALSLARRIAEDTDPDLYGDACVEVFDVAPPTLAWDPLTPAANAFVHGTIYVHASATDDADAYPYTHIEGSTSDWVAIDTTAKPDGPLELTATSIDDSGRWSMITRTVIVDNTAPVVRFDETSVNGNTLFGSVNEANELGAVTASLGCCAYLGEREGIHWTIALPNGALAAGENRVVVDVRDRAGNIGSASATIIR